MASCLTDLLSVLCDALSDVDPYRACLMDVRLRECNDPGAYKSRRLVICHFFDLKQLSSQYLSAY
jgi:transposase